MASFEAEDAATRIMRLAVDTIASSDPSTAARSHPARPLRCISRCGLDIRFALGLSEFSERRVGACG
jgi:hypothetical protein